MVNAPLRILHVIDTLEVGGAQRHLQSLVASLQARGHRCLIATAGEGRLGGSKEVPVFSLTREPVSYRLPLRFTARLVRLLARERVDIVHAHLHAASLAAAVAASTHRRPLVVTHHSDRARQPHSLQMLDRWTSWRAHTTIVVARSLVQPHVPSVLIPNGVAILLERCVNRGRLRAELRIPPRAFVAGFTGRFVGDKDPLLFVEMAGRVVAANDAAHFLMVGDGPLRVEVERRIARHGLGSRFTLTGMRQDASRLYGAVDVVAVPSRRDACPLVPLEAMAAGCPVVGTRVGDVPDQIADGVTGYVVPPGDAGCMAAAVLALADPSRRRQFGRAGRERVAERYSLERMVDRTLAVYADALRAEERPLTERTERPAAAPAAERAR